MKSIQFIGVTKSYPNGLRPAVKDCSLLVEAGKLVVLMGPSGSGKTTLLKMVNRLIEPDEGQIFISSTEIHQLEPTSLRKQIGYVIQQIGLFPHLTVAQNIAIVPELLKWTPDRIRSRVDELLNLVALPTDEYGPRYPYQLSGGQQQRVGLARALAADPDILLMDEPFGALDALTRRDLQEHLLRLQQQLHKTILFVTHDVDEALHLADWMVLIRAGQIVQAGVPLDLFIQPKESFVEDIIGSGDILRRLSLVPLAAVLQGDTNTGKSFVNQLPQIAEKESLRSALSLMLRTGATALSIVRDGEKVGMVTLDQIRAFVMPGEPPTRA
jgi:osmoprotectant transport system ATP-binding protein